MGTAVAAVALVLAGCANAKNGASGGGTGAPGVSSNLIQVGSIANVTGPLSSDFAPVVNGVQAYFSMINAEGGVAGRKLQLAYQTDDQGSSTTDLTDAQKLVEQDHVFAVVGVGTPFFGGAGYLAEQGVPTFGYAVSTDWQNRPTLYADYGSELCFPCGAPGDAYLAQELGANSIAVVSYSVPQSAAACQAAVNGMKNNFGENVSFTDLSFPFGSDPTADVLQMKAHNVDLLFTCLDVTGNVAFAKAMSQNGLSINQVWFNGYDPSTVQQYGSIMNGVYFGLQHVPFQAALAYPGLYPGLDLYIREMQKYQKAYTYNETALDGWMAADQFVTGLKLVGRNLTQKKLVTALNNTTGFTGGLTTPVPWTQDHFHSPPPYCQASVVVEGGAYHVAFAHNGEVFTCFGSETSDTPVAPPAGTPGLSSSSGSGNSGTSGNSGSSSSTG